MVDDFGSSFYDELTAEERKEFDRSCEIRRQFQYDWGSVGLGTDRQTVLSSPKWEVRYKAYAPLAYYMKNEYSVARNQQGKPDYPGPLTVSEAVLVPNGFHVGNPYHDPALRTDGSTLRDIAFFRKRNCDHGTGSHIGTVALNEEQFTPANLYYKDAMELDL